jgi:hypothetical protein
MLSRPKSNHGHKTKTGRAGSAEKYAIITKKLKRRRLRWRQISEAGLKFGLSKLRQILRMSQFLSKLEFWVDLDNQIQNSFLIMCISVKTKLDYKISIRKNISKLE